MMPMLTPYPQQYWRASALQAFSLVALSCVGIFLASLAARRLLLWRRLRRYQDIPSFADRSPSSSLQLAWQPGELPSTSHVDSPKLLRQDRLRSLVQAALGRGAGASVSMVSVGLVHQLERGRTQDGAKEAGSPLFPAGSLAAAGSRALASRSWGLHSRSLQLQLEHLRVSGSITQKFIYSGVNTLDAHRLCRAFVIPMGSRWSSGLELTASGLQFGDDVTQTGIASLHSFGKGMKTSQ